MDALIIAPFHDEPTARSSTVARLALSLFRRENFNVYSLERNEATREGFEAFLNERMQEGKGSPEIVFYAGHGLSHCLQGQNEGEPILDALNVMRLAGSTVLAVSCRSAKELGRVSILEGVKNFCGWTADLFLPMVQQGTRNYQADFLQTFLLLALLIGKGHTIEYTINEFKELTQHYMDKYKEEKPLFWEDSFSWMLNNQKAIECHGDLGNSVKPSIFF